MRPFERERRLLPEFPSTPHLPFQPNTGRGDCVASEEDAQVVFSSPRLTIEEKMDGAFLGMTLDDDQVIIRNRDHILRKGYVARTEAKRQFASAWNYAYQQADKLRHLQGLAGAPVAVCGEWLVLTHGTRYEAARVKRCPFVAFDLYDPEEGRYLDPLHTRWLLAQVGFTMPDLIDRRAYSYEHLAQLASQPSSWSKQDPREGLYLKMGDGKYLTHRFKMVRPGFEPGKYLTQK